MLINTVIITILVFQLIKSLKFKIQKLNEMLQEANEVCRKAVEENNRLKQVINLKVGLLSGKTVSALPLSLLFVICDSVFHSVLFPITSLI